MRIRRAEAQQNIQRDGTPGRWPRFSSQLQRPRRKSKNSSARAVLVTAAGAWASAAGGALDKKGVWTICCSRRASDGGWGAEKSGEGCSGADGGAADCGAVAGVCPAGWPGGTSGCAGGAATPDIRLGAGGPGFRFVAEGAAVC
jgi:hypothetical protein